MHNKICRHSSANDVGMMVVVYMAVGSVFLVVKLEMRGSCINLDGGILKNYSDDFVGF
jgi:hypothetical protein